MARPKKGEGAKDKQALVRKKTTDVSIEKKSVENTTPDINLQELEQEMDNDSKMSSSISNDNGIEDVDFEEQVDDES